MLSAMKKVVLSFVFATAALLAQAQNDAIIRFFNQYTQDERFTVVYVSPKMFDMASKIETNDPEWNNFRSVVKDLTGLRVLQADSINNAVALYKDALNRVPVGEYEELLTVRDGQENVRIWIKESNNVIGELLLLVGNPKEFTLLSFTGKIDLSKISALSKALDVKGTEHLKKVPTKQ
jgi:Domain of unknown function (DUF4252)